MASTLPYQFHPQPPPGPKQTGGKRGPSGPINIPTSSSEDEDSDQSITDFSPPLGSRFILSDLGTGSAAKLNCVITVANLSSPRGSFLTKKSTGQLPSPRNVNTTSHTSNGTLLQTNGSKPVVSSNSVSPASVGQNLSSTSVLSSLPTSLPPAVPALATHTKSSLVTQNNSLTSQIPNVTPISVNGEEDAPTVSNSVGKAFLSVNTPPASPRHRSFSPTTHFAHEHDHDYENVASPCSSTASGPTYVRPPGFDFHAQEVTVSSKKLKKKKSSEHSLNVGLNGLKGREATQPKIKPKRGELSFILS